MIGDVNLFFNDADDRRSAEIEVMIAEPTARGRGLGHDACVAMMNYGVTSLNVGRFTAKIGFDNERSLRMFQRMEFTQISASEVFRETTLERVVSPASQDELTQKATELGFCPQQYACDHQ
eukprot:Opistho-2@78553